MTNPLLHNRNVNLSNVNDNDPTLTTTTTSFPATTSMIISQSTTIHQDPISSDNNHNNNNNKIRTNHRRTQHVKVSKYNNCNGGSVYNRPNSSRRKCLKCKESSSNVEMLKNQVTEIEKLVNSLAQKTQILANDSQRSRQLKPKFRGIDLTNASLEEIQKLVKITTDIILSPSPKTPISIEEFQSLSILPTSSPQLLGKTIHSEPIQETLEEGVRRGEEGVIIPPPSLSQNIINNNPSHPYNNTHHHNPYISSIVNDGKQVNRQDSGFSESNHQRQHHNKPTDN